MGRHVPPRLGTCHLSMLIVVLLHIVLVYFSYSEFWILNYDKWSSEFWILARVKIVLFVIRILLFMIIVLNSLFCDWSRRSHRNDHCHIIIPFIRAGLSHIIFLVDISSFISTRSSTGNDVTPIIIFLIFRNDEPCSSLVK